MIEKEEKIKQPKIQLEGYDFGRLFDLYKQGKMAIFIVDMTRRCNLRCIYCSTDAGEAREDEMSLNTYLDLVQQCRNLGATTLSVEGEGEPLLDKNLIPVLQKAKDLSMKSIVFTNGTLIDERNAEQLSKLDTSLVVKLNSLNSKVHDGLTGAPGSFEKARRGLQILINRGFNSPEIDEKTGNLSTKLGIEAIICKATLEEIPRLIQFARDNNIYPVLDMIEHEGRAASDFFQEQSITMEENKRLFEQVGKILGYPYVGPIGPQCPQLISFNVSNTGEVKVSTCGASCSVEPERLVGNVLDKPVSELYREVRKLREDSHLTEIIESGLLKLEGYGMFPHCPIQIRLLELHGVSD